MKLKLVAAAAAVVMAWTVPATAQDAGTANPETLALARRVIEVTTPDFDKQMLAHMRAAIQEAALDEIDTTVGQWMEKNAGPILLPHMHRFMDDIATLYARRFSADELQAMVTFYESPMGASIAAKQVSVGMETGQMVEPLMERYATDLFGQLCQDIDCTAAKGASGTSSKPAQR